ncbi:MAG: serine/threonine-protein phosphatase [Ktedonobacteraceae bacterium]|nr:serine/threonine-protein phosphatase [Ktedonobacteraceae bacterium]
MILLWLTSRAPLSMPFDLMVIANGMGGQGHGKEASELAVGYLSEYLLLTLCSERRPPEDVLSLLEAGVQYANKGVYERNQRQGTEMGTTMTAVLVIGAVAYVAHVGDSRLYLYRQSVGLTQITRDHSMVAILVEQGIIAPEDIYTHPLRSRIYRSLGDQAEVEIDTSVVPLAAGDNLLLCSDGLWEMVRDSQIAGIVASRLSTPANEACALIQAALAGGGDDNVSAVVAQVS